MLNLATCKIMVSYSRIYFYPMMRNFWRPPINPFHASVLFLYPLKTSENLWFSDVFRWYRNSTVVWKRLSHFISLVSFYNPWKLCWVSDVFKWYRKTPPEWNGLNTLMMIQKSSNNKENDRIAYDFGFPFYL